MTNNPSNSNIGTRKKFSITCNIDISHENLKSRKNDNIHEQYLYNTLNIY